MKKNYLTYLTYLFFIYLAKGCNKALKICFNNSSRLLHFYHVTDTVTGTPILTASGTWSKVFSHFTYKHRQRFQMLSHLSRGICGEKRYKDNLVSFTHSEKVFILPFRWFQSWSQQCSLNVDLLLPESWVGWSSFAATWMEAFCLFLFLRQVLMSPRLATNSICSWE